ncbi:hypothetical protein B9Z55_019023 [Caenorhabditis nigoni]|uniref:Uncharacterized protein n=1 Tax=Caenorhabditis nigoni TaxID=1611254 RepID=A0A2G5THB1_9PELO|nr:hypothetical protein B9Z55_019023 [Caenorhabditis nigoni]
MRSPICDELPGQLGWQGIRSNQRRLLGFSTRLWDSRRIGRRTTLDAVNCQEASDALLIAISFFFKLIDVIEVKKVLKGLRSPLFGVHG